MQVREALLDDLWIVQLIAKHTWHHTFQDILSEGQIAYMMEMMYSTSALEKQLSDGHHYLLIEDAAEYVGYLSYEENYNDSLCLKIHKIYVMPQAQGRGIGRILLERVEAIAKEHNQSEILLNVNRDNKAIGFYEKMGFSKLGTEDIDIGNGFLMEDYIMNKKL